jgi:hypothetical protein
MPLFKSIQFKSTLIKSTWLNSTLFKSTFAAFVLCAVTSCWASTALLAADDAGKDEHKISLAGGAVSVQVPEQWKKKTPENNIIEYEFAASPAEGEKEPGRVTVMGAGGTVEANVERWINQFTQPDGGDTHKIAKQKEVKVGGLDVLVVDIAGTYKDSRGPFSKIPAVERPKYRMLAAIIKAPKGGNYFIKFYGGEQTVAENEKAFQKMIDSVETK